MNDNMAVQIRNLYNIDELTYKQLTQIIKQMEEENERNIKD